PCRSPRAARCGAANAVRHSSPAACPSCTTHPITRLTMRTPEAASVRLERRLAVVTVGAPALGFAVAIALAAQQGIGALELGLMLGMYLTTACGIEAGFHRYFSHRAFRTGRAMTCVLAVLGSMAAQGPVLFWASTHRRHHAFTDREGD